MLLHRKGKSKTKRVSDREKSLIRALIMRIYVSPLIFGRRNFSFRFYDNLKQNIMRYILI